MPKTNFKIDEITLLLVVAVIAMIVVVNDKINGSKTIEPEKLTQLILDGNIGLEHNGIIDENQLKIIEKTEYTRLKDNLNVKNDFCIYIEDGKGNIILSKGSPKLTQDGVTCKE